ncbi:MAG: hypothetical protein AAGC71_12590 [Pseudomonadota bacterium]
MTIEIVFYIHGVSPDTRGGEHTATYREMHLGIAAAMAPGSLWPTEFGGAEWGWNYDGGSAESHKQLVDAQRIFGEQVMAEVRASEDFPTNPLTRGALAISNIRDLMFHGFGDMFYYVSAEGKWAVRYAVATQLKQHIERRRGDSDEGVSLTLLGHSAGAVIAFDFSYYLFNERQFVQPSAARGEPPLSRFATDARRTEVQADLEYLRDLQRNNRLRLRRLVTFGAPISLLMFRSDTLVELLADGKTLPPERYGLTSELPDELLAPAAPRWINIWDKDDLIAWPTASIMKSPLAADVYVDVSDSVRKSHNLYWSSRRCHRAIAERW